MPDSFSMRTRCRHDLQRARYMEPRTQPLLGSAPSRPSSRRPSRGIRYSPRSLKRTFHDRPKSGCCPLSRTGAASSRGVARGPRDVPLSTRLNELNTGNPAQALDPLEQQLRIVRASGNRRDLAWGLRPVATALILLGRPDHARQCIAEALTIFNSWATAPVSASCTASPGSPTSVACNISRRCQKYAQPKCSSAEYPIPNQRLGHACSQRSRCCNGNGRMANRSASCNGSKAADAHTVAGQLGS